MKLLIISLLLLSFSKQVLADSYLFVGAAFPGVFEKDKDGILQGLAVDLVNEISSRTGDDIVLALYPWNRALHMVQTGQADALIGPYKNIEREIYLTFNAYPFYNDEMFFFVTQESKFGWNGLLSSLKKTSIGVTNGWSYGSLFDGYRENLNINSVETVSANFQSLLLNRIDTLVTNERSAINTISALGIGSKIKKILPRLVLTEGYFGFTKQKDLTSFMQAFDAELLTLIENGTLERLNNKYGLTYTISFK